MWVSPADDLAHHGILGMKWGVRHGPPYPLKPSVSARIQKSAKTDSGASSEGGLFKPSKRKIARELATNKVNWDDTKLSDRMELIRNAKKDSSLSAKTVAGMRAAAAGVNPHYKDKLPANKASAYKMNCVLCSWTYELRRRGYDLEAQPMNGAGVRTYKTRDGFRTYDGKKLKVTTTHVEDDDDFGKLQEDLEHKRINRTEFSKGVMDIYKKTVDSYMKNMPDNARGLLSLRNAYYGHCVSWEKNKGVVYIIDSQCNETMTYRDLYNMGVMSMGFSRTDNTMLTDKILYSSRLPTNRGGNGSSK